MNPRRLFGLAAAVGSVAVLASLALQAVVPVPDSHQFDPALTAPQGLRDTVAPALTVAGIAGYLGGLYAAGHRDRSTFGRVHFAGAVATGAGLALAVVGYAGLFLTDTATGSVGILVGALSALVVVLALGVTGVGTGLLGVALARGPRRVDRLLGGLFLAAPLLAVGASLVDLGPWSPLAAAPAAVAFAALGLDVYRRPDREDER